MEIKAEVKGGSCPGPAHVIFFVRNGMKTWLPLSLVRTKQRQTYAKETRQNKRTQSHKTTILYSQAITWRGPHAVETADES